MNNSQYSNIYLTEDIMFFAGLKTCKLAYRIYGNKSNPCIVIETALAASCSEWWHLAEKWSDRYTVLLYDRAGYGLSSESTLDRKPENIATELNELLIFLGLSRVILIGHSIGGLYAYQFSRQFPQKMLALILLDPVAPSIGKLKTKLTRKEYKSSGIDKSLNLRIGYLICALGLGSLLKPFLKKSPPFYYYDKFSQEAKDYILMNLTNKKMYKTAIKEYAWMNNGTILSDLNIIAHTADFGVYLICHSSEVMRYEIEFYGNVDATVSEKIDRIWLDIMKEYLVLSEKSTFIQAKDSAHAIHLTNSELIYQSIESACAS